MKNSLIRKITILVSSILITSVLFLGAVYFAYNRVYQQTVLSTNENVSSRWTDSIDLRLNMMYEHLYDLLVTLFNDVAVRPGSQPMDYTEQSKIQDAMNYKIMTSSDITAVFVLDSESSLYLFVQNSTVPQAETFNLKLFTQQYCLEHHSSLNQKRWDVIDILEKGYYYKAVKMGKYLVGMISQCNLYAASDPGVTCFIKSDDQSFCISGRKDLESVIIDNRNDDYFSQSFAVSTTEQKSANALTVYLTKPSGFTWPWRLAALFLIVDSALCVLLVAILINDLNKRVKVPIGELITANKELSNGNLDYRLDPEQAGSSEFSDLYTSFNEMSGKITQLTIESYDLRLKREQNSLKMLRAQMRPHTFLNGITTISNMTYTSKPEDIRKYISQFAAFTRYMLRKEDWTTIEDELKNIDSYVNMQKIRFPNSIDICYNCPNELKLTRIPFLTVQTMVENSFKHAMTLVNTMHINIIVERYEEENFRGIRIIEEDDGPGFSPEALKKLELTEEDTMFTKEHLGLTNVRYTMNLIYSREDLLRISNPEHGGARIELLIPQEDKNDTVSM